MKTSTKILLFAIFMGSCSLANAKSVEVWNCKLNDGKSFADLMAVSSAWLAATKSMEGAEEIEAYHEYPVVTDVADGGFNFVVILPDLELFGKLAQAYPGSASQKADEAWGEVATCSGNSLWSSEKVK
jgi:hypothetical protein